MTLTDDLSDIDDDVGGVEDGKPVTGDRLSVLGQLGQRREEIARNETLDLAVPRWTDPEVIVRYKYVDHALIRRGADAIEKAIPKRRASVELAANSDVLIAGCIAVIARLDGQEYSLRVGDFEGEPTRFDHDLAANLGLVAGANARQVVKALFIADGDIMSHAQAVAQFSGYRETEADAGILGE